MEHRWYHENSWESSSSEDINLQDKTVVSFDVDSLFTRVPVNEVVDFLREKVNTFDLELPFPNDVFIKLIELCV